MNYDQLRNWSSSWLLGVVCGYAPSLPPVSKPCALQWVPHGCLSITMKPQQLAPIGLASFNELYDQFITTLKCTQPIRDLYIMWLALNLSLMVKVKQWPL